MEIEFRDNKRRSGVIVAIGVVLALVAGGIAFMVVNKAQQQAGQTAAARVPVVVAVASIPARTEIKASDVTIREVPLDDSNANGVATHVEDVVGRVPAVSILQGQLVTTNMLASTSSGAAFSILEPGESLTPETPEWRAVAITVSDDLAVGGMLQTGMTVDVFVTAVVQVPESLADQGYYSDRATKITYQDMVILAKKDAFYVLKAPVAVAEEIIHMQATGTVTFSLALRPDVDQRPVDATTMGETTNRIIEKYGLPLPQNVTGRPGPRLPVASPSPVATPTPSASPVATPALSAAPSASPGA